jgi:hypothetical protein
MEISPGWLGNIIFKIKIPHKISQQTIFSGFNLKPSLSMSF